MKLAGFTVGAREPLFLIAGPCVIESEALVLSMAERLKSIAAKLALAVGDMVTARASPRPVTRLTCERDGGRCGRP